MILPTIFLILIARLTESLDAGEFCNLTYGGRGICTPVYDCESVNDEVLAGGFPDTICGYKGDNPIICCPHDSMRTTAPAASFRRGGEIAKAKCASYAANVSQCAVNPDDQISSGKARRMEFPYMAALGYRTPGDGIQWFCSGALISESYVLTAAHCTNLLDHFEVEWARLGSLKLVDKAGDKGRVLRIIKRINHPDYKPPAQYNDIALLRLEREVPLNGLIRPACLYTGSSTDVTELIETAWDYLDWKRVHRLEDLWKTKLSMSNVQDCKSFWNTFEKYLPRGLEQASSICAKSDNDNTCSGESGAPLVTYSNSDYCMYNVVGIGSLGKFCRYIYPGVYTRVSNYVPWIESVVWPQG